MVNFNYHIYKLSSQTEKLQKHIHPGFTSHCPHEELLSTHLDFPVDKAQTIPTLRGRGPYCHQQRSVFN
uniref:Uncharacterized protein n=1 Tax=Rhizophora mucronata TaxID=61149 RepID=A0A2P2KJM0_RHIMU